MIIKLLGYIAIICGIGACIGMAFEKIGAPAAKQLSACQRPRGDK